MSTETPETRNPYQLRREAVARAIKAWQRQAEEADDAGDREPTAVENASDLEDCLMDEGLLLAPRSTGYGKWRVLVDGQPAPYVGQEQLSHPMGAEEAAELFLAQTAADYYAQKQIVIRPASDEELITAAVLGDTTVREEPVKIVACGFLVETDSDTGAALLRVIDKDGNEVRVGLDDHMRDSLRWILTPEGDLDAESSQERENLAVETCGDCESGRCHGDGPCGCARHDVSVEAAQAEQTGGESR